MGKLLDAESMVGLLEGMIEHLEENYDEDHVFLIGDIGDLSLTASDGSDVKKLSPDIVFPKEVFAESGVRDLSKEANIALLGTVAVPRCILSDEAVEVLESDREQIGGDGSE